MSPWPAPICSARVFGMHPPRTSSNVTSSEAQGASWALATVGVPASTRPKSTASGRSQVKRRGSKLMTLSLSPRMVRTEPGRSAPGLRGRSNGLTNSDHADCASMVGLPLTVESTRWALDTVHRKRRAALSTNTARPESEAGNTWRSRAIAKPADPSPHCGADRGPRRFSLAPLARACSYGPPPSIGQVSGGGGGQLPTVA